MERKIKGLERLRVKIWKEKEWKKKKKERRNRMKNEPQKGFLTLKVNLPRAFVRYDRHKLF